MSLRRLADQLDKLVGRVAFVLDGEEWEVPEHPVLDWIAAVVDDDYDAVIPGLLHEEDARDLYERLYDEDDPLDQALCRQIALDVIAQAGGRPWYEVNSLLVIALDSWATFDAWCAHECNGLDPRTLPLARLCNLLERFVQLSCKDDNERQAFLDRLHTPPAGAVDDLADRPEWSDEETADSFEQAWASMGRG